MNVVKLEFRGDLNAPGEWYGKIEKDLDNKDTLVLFKRSGTDHRQGLANFTNKVSKKLADRQAGVHKGVKLLAQVLLGQTITIQEGVKSNELLGRYMSSAIQNDTTLNQIAHIIGRQRDEGDKTPVEFIAFADKTFTNWGPDKLTVKWDPNGVIT